MKPEDKKVEQTQNSELTVRYITTESEFNLLRDDWIRLHKISDTAGLFNSWYWNRLWWQYYGDLGELFIIVVSVDNVVQGIAPLYRCHTKVLKLHNVMTLRFIGSGGDTAPDNLGVLHNADFTDVVMENTCQLIFHASECTRLQLNDMNENSDFEQSLIKSALARKWGRPHTHQQHRHVDALPSTIEMYEKNLSRNARKNRKRRRQLLGSAAKKIQFKTCVSLAEINSAFKELVRLHHLRHASKGGSDSFQSDRYQQFHVAVMEKALACNELRLMSLIVDDKTIGVEYAFLCKGTLSFFQTGFDPAFQHLSPGHLLMMETIDRAIQDNAKYVDLLKGDYEYKQSYAKQKKTTSNLELWKSPAIGLIAGFYRHIS
ncbi:MAG: GNAT family N-acetyltransferase [Granulosicoccus sp.]